MTKISFSGQECTLVANEAVELLITTSVGPRILSFRFPDGENIFAELPDFTIDCPGSGEYHVYGGHRLWHAPEVPARTYLPDDAPVDIASVDGKTVVTQQIEARTGIQKSIEIQVDPAAATVVLTHHLSNRGLWPATCAPWAITQLKVGGVAILPQATEETGVLPNRSLAFWPYTDPADPNVRWGKDSIRVRAEMEAPFKIGFPNPRGWLAYWRDGTLFVKSAAYRAGADYYDYGSSSECYCNDRFLELETLGPIRTIEPGETASHVETWHLFRDIEMPPDAQAVERLLAAAAGSDHAADS
jgi:hypothetical protein